MASLSLIYIAYHNIVTVATVDSVPYLGLENHIF